MTSQGCLRLLPPLATLAASAGLACSFALPVHAAERSPMLYKCVSAAGVTSIQSSPCPAGATTAWKRAAPAEAPPSPAASAQAEAKRLNDQQTVRVLSAEVERQRARDLAARQAAASTATDDDDDTTIAEAATGVERPAVPPSPPAVPDASLQSCQDAQAFANAAREKEWLALSEDQIRRMYGWVAQQCKLPGA